MFKYHVAKLLSAYCDHELPAAERQRVQTHLQSCASCRQAYEQIKFGMALAQQMKTVAAPESLWFAVLQQNATSAKTTAINFNWRIATAIAAVLILALAGWVGFSRLQPKSIEVVQSNIPRVEKTETTPIPNGTIALTPNESGNKTASIPKSQPTKTAPLTVIPKVALSPAPTWEVASLAGTPSIGTTKINGTEKIAVGEWLATDNVSRAKIKIANIGFVDIEPNSRVQFVSTQNSAHRIALKKGKLRAFILAPPRLFVVDTPSATAVDLGCAYTLEVDEAGNSLLHVTSGWVSFVLPSGKNSSRESLIPAGAMCATRKGAGVGTPYFANASTTFIAALQKLDFGPGEIAGTFIKTILAESRPADALTLWHLLDQEKWQASLRGQIFDRLTELTPPPAGVTRTGILQGDRKMLAQWWQEKIR